MEMKGRLLGRTVKVCFVLAMASYVAAHWLAADPAGEKTVARVAAAIGMAPEPRITSALAPVANEVRLDPCAAPRRP
jgi:hypothetical protein